MENKELLTVDLTDIVFEHRNRLYGAYEIRKGYNIVVQKSMLSSVLLLGCFVLLVSFSRNTIQAEEVCVDEGDTYVITEVVLPKNLPIPEKKVNNPTPARPKPIPAASKPTIALADPVVVADEMVEEADKMPEQKDFVEAEAGTKTQAGDVNAVAATSSDGTAIEASFVDTTEANVIKKTVVTAPTVDENVYTSVEEYPQFGNGDKDLLKYLNKNIEYPSAAQDMGVEGKIYVRFIVEKDGSISDVRVINGPEFGGLREEAVRVVSNMPKWKAGRQNGMNVKVWHILPIVFKLEH